VFHNRHCFNGKLLGGGGGGGDISRK